MGSCGDSSFLQRRRVVGFGRGRDVTVGFDLSGRLVFVDTPSAGTSVAYVPGPDGTLARVDQAGVVSFQHADHLGSGASATNAAGAVLWRERYTPFGEKLLAPAANDNQASFTGHIDDAATGLTYMQARYYDPALGRFLAIDPVEFSAARPDMFNRYAYAANDPVNAVDPDGRQAAEPPASFWARAQGHEERAAAMDRVDRANAAAVVDFMPIVGDIKGVAEAVRNPSVANVAVAALGIVPGAGDAASKGVKGGLNLYRAVGPAEAADLAATGVFRNAGSAEGKYFSTTEAGARSYATQAERAFGDPPYAFVRTTIPLESVTPDMRTTVDGGIDTVVVPDNMLADLKPEFID